MRCHKTLAPFVLLHGKPIKGRLIHALRKLRLLSRLLWDMHRLVTWERRQLRQQSQHDIGPLLREIADLYIVHIS